MQTGVPQIPGRQTQQFQPVSRQSLPIQNYQSTNVQFGGTQIRPQSSLNPLVGSARNTVAGMTPGPQPTGYPQGPYIENGVANRNGGFPIVSNGQYPYPLNAQQNSPKNGMNFQNPYQGNIQNSEQITNAGKVQGLNQYDPYESIDVISQLIINFYGVSTYRELLDKSENGVNLLNKLQKLDPKLLKDPVYLFKSTIQPNEIEWE